MEPMRRRSLFRLCVFAAGFGLIVTALGSSAQEAVKRGRKYKSPPPTARIEVTVLRDVNSKPIENAAVIFHLTGETGNMELKTNQDGKAGIDGLPMGSTVRLQIIAKGFQTYGEDFKIDKAALGIDVKMKRPGEQYSIYKNHGGAAEAGKDAAPAPAKEMPSGSAAQPDSQPSQPRPQ